VATPKILRVAIFSILTAVVAACSSGATASPVATAAPTAALTAVPTAAPAAAAAGSGPIVVAKTVGSIGTVLVASNGMTVCTGRRRHVPGHLQQSADLLLLRRQGSR
jgi:hypothetical protein